MSPSSDFFATLPQAAGPPCAEFLRTSGKRRAIMKQKCCQLLNRNRRVQNVKAADAMLHQWCHLGPNTIEFRCNCIETAHCYIIPLSFSAVCAAPSAGPPSRAAEGFVEKHLAGIAAGGGRATDSLRVGGNWRKPRSTAGAATRSRRCARRARKLPSRPAFAGRAGSRRSHRAAPAAGSRPASSIVVGASPLGAIIRW